MHNRRALYTTPVALPVEINKLARACAFDGRVSAEIATRLRARTGGEVYIAPGEADPQLL